MADAAEGHPNTWRFTLLSRGTGGGCKLRPAELAQVLRELTPARRPKSLLVGTETSDDAAVWKLDAKRGLVATVDFFAPVVDDPRDYGQIAAANSLSDVYAMGGTPLYALNIVGWPRSQPFELLGEILAGGAEVARKADCPIVGGHSVDDLEPKYGLAVTGLVHPKRVLSNAGAKPGDVILLGKALGTGIAVSAIKKGIAASGLVREAVAQMKQLNRSAGAGYARHLESVHALTDVTGLGLLGHLRSAKRASKTRARIDAAQIAVLPDVRELAREGVVPAGTRANLEFVSVRARFPASMTEPDRLGLAEAQANCSFAAGGGRE